MPSQVLLDGNSYDAYDFQPNGKPLASTRIIIDTVPTLGTSSRSVITTHKKQWTLSFFNLSTAERAALATSMDKNTFTFRPYPYDSTEYTVKKIAYGVPGYKPNSTALWDWTGIILEVD